MDFRKKGIYSPYSHNITSGQLLNMPSTGSQTEQPPLVPAENMGYWHWTYEDSTNPADATLSIAFSGWADVDTALQESTKVKDTLVGDKYICLGGGNENGALTSTCVQAITAAINTDRFSGYDGIAYDVEEEDSGLEDYFSASFAAAKVRSCNHIFSGLTGTDCENITPSTTKAQCRDADVLIIIY